MLVAAVSLLSILAGLIYYYFKRQLEYWKDRGVAYVEPTMPYGNLEGYARVRKLPSPEDFLNLYMKLKGKGPYGGIYFFTAPMVYPTDLDFIKGFMIKDFNHFIDRGIFFNEKDDPLSAHLVHIEGDKWKNLRAKLTPTFSSAKLKMMVPTILNVAEHFKDTLNKDIQKNSVVEMKDLLARFTTDIIGSCAFGIDCNCLNDPSAEFLKMGQEVFVVQKNQMLKQVFMGIFPNLARKLGLKVIREDVAEFYMKVVTEVVEHRESSKVPRSDFMNILIELKNSGQMTFNEIAAEAFVFIVAGYETSSTLMTFCIHELAQNPDIQDKLREDIFNVLEKHDGRIDYDSVSEMNYLEQCMNEALRKYPPGTLIVRKCNKDYPVPNTNLVIEKGNGLMVSIYAIHHDPEYYPDPQKYDPDRFSPTEVEKRHPFAFLPFGAGPRNCIGMRFAMLETKIGLATLLKNFKFTKNPKTIYPTEFDKDKFILTPEGGIYVNVEKV